MPFNVNSNIYVWARNIFHFDRRTERGNVSQRRQLFPYLNSLECLFEGAFDLIARDRVEFPLSSLIRQWRRLPASVFSAKRVFRNESQRKRICARSARAAALRTARWNRTTTDSHRAARIRPCGGACGKGGPAADGCVVRQA